MKKSTWPLPPGFPPQSPPQIYYFAIRVRDANGATLPLNNRAAFLGGIEASQWHPSYGSGLYGWRYVPGGIYRLRVVIPAIGPLRNFELVIDPITGSLVTDPTWPGASMPQVVIPTPQLDIAYPDDFKWSHCAIAVDAPFVYGLSEGTLWANDRPLVPQGGYYRGTLPPGEYRLRLEHPRYVLAPQTAPIALNSTAFVSRVTAQVAPSPVTVLEIRGASFYADVSDLLRFRTNVPAGFEADVRWMSKNPDVLAPDARPGWFRAARAGVASIEAKFRHLVASAQIVVRDNPTEIVVRPVDPASVVSDEWVGTYVAAGEVMCAFRPDVSQTDMSALLDMLSLSRVGEIPSLRAYQLAFNPSAQTLRSVVETLNQDARVSWACPNAALRLNALAPYRPSELKIPLSYWHLQKMEALPAFGVMKKLKRDPVGIRFVDSGVWVSSTGKTHRDFADRLLLSHSGAFVRFTMVRPSSLQFLRDDELSELHGTKSIGVAAAAWDNDGAAGIDPLAEVAMLKTRSTKIKGELYVWTPDTLGAFTYAYKNIWPNERIICLTTTCGSPRPLKDLFNRAFAHSLRILLRGTLVVVAAGNSGTPAADEGLASAGLLLSETESRALIVVAATDIPKPGPYEPPQPNGPERDWENTNHDVPGGQHVVDLAAPAEALASNYEDGYAQYFGTSCAAPLVAGVAAVLFSVAPRATAADAKRWMLETCDPIPPIDVLGPPQRLAVSPGRKLGAGRVNLWQALLYALNNKLMTQGTWYVGLRMTADLPDLEIHLVRPGVPHEVLSERTVKNDPSSTAATRVTVTNADGGGGIPVEVWLYQRGEADPLYKQDLQLDAASVRKLDPRYVKTLRMFTRGKMNLEQQTDGALPPNRARFKIHNDGPGPDDPKIDLEMLDPQLLSPWDKSLRPWMKLANGDSFVVKATGPVGSVVDVLDSQGSPFGDDTDDEGDTYRTIPFKSSAIFEVVLRAVPPPLTEAVVLVKVTSLNNRKVSKEVPVTLKVVAGPNLVEAADAGSVLYGPWQWPREVRLWIKNVSRPPLELTIAHTYQPADWAHGGPASTPFGLNHNQTRRFSAKFGPVRPTPAGTRGSITLEARDDATAAVLFRREFASTISPTPDVVFEPTIGPAGVFADHVIPDGRYVYADFGVTLKNRAQHPVQLRHPEFRATNPPSPMFHPDWLQLVGFFPPFSSNRRDLAPGESASCTMRLYYNRALATAGPGATIVTHQVSWYLFSEADTGFGWFPDDKPPQSSALDVRVYLKLI